MLTLQLNLPNLTNPKMQRGGGGGVGIRPLKVSGYIPLYNGGVLHVKVGADIPLKP